MLAVQNENVLSNENQNIQPKTCEYKGLTYFVLTDMNGKCFINVDGKKKYLDKNGCVCNKQKYCFYSYQHYYYNQPPIVF